MSTPFVTFPGSAGNFLSTDDVNKLDADSAHLHQSEGLWTVGALSTDFPFFGDKSLKVTGGVDTAITPTVDAAIFSAFIYSVAGATFDINGGGVAVPAGVWTQLQETGPDGTYTIGSSTGADYYVGKACVRAGTDPTFVPSLRIVGNDFSEIELALDDYTPSSSEVLWDDGATKCTIDTAGDFTFEMWGDASAALSPSSALTNGVKYQITLVGIQSTGAITFAIDAVVQDTDTLTPGSPTYADLNVGASTTPNLEAAGDFYSYTRRDGDSDGPVVARFDAVDAAKATL